MLALIDSNNNIVTTISAGGWVDLPDGSRLSPAYDGWQNDHYRLSGVEDADPVPEGKRIVTSSVELVGGVPKWVHILVDLDPNERKSQLSAYAADVRWQKEVGGTLWNGWPVHTDRESQGKIIAERLAIEAGERDDPDGWKFADGQFRMVSNADFIDLSNAVRDHVRQCYAIEALVLTKIETGDITSEAEIDAAFD